MSVGDEIKKTLAGDKAVAGAESSAKSAEKLSQEATAKPENQAPKAADKAGDKKPAAEQAAASSSLFQQGLDVASNLISDAYSVLPNLVLTSEAEKSNSVSKTVKVGEKSYKAEYKKEDKAFDMDAFIQDNCKTDSNMSSVCKTSDIGIPGLDLVIDTATPVKQVQGDHAKNAATLKLGEGVLDKQRDLQNHLRQEATAVGDFSALKNLETIDGRTVHRNEKGEIDAYQIGDIATFIRPDGTTIEATPKGKTFYDKDGKLLGHLNADGELNTRLSTGEDLIVNANGDVYMRDKNGELQSAVFDGKGTQVGFFKDGQIIRTNQSIPGNVTDANDAATQNALDHDQIAISRYKDGVKISYPNGQMLFVKDDGTAGVALDNHNVLVRKRDANGAVTYELHVNGQKPKVMTREEVGRLNLGPHASKQDLAVIMGKLAKLEEFAKTGKLTVDGVNASLEFKGNAIVAQVNGQTVTTSPDKVEYTDIRNGNKTTMTDDQYRIADQAGKELLNIDRSDKTQKPKVTVNGLKYQGGVVTTPGGDRITKDRVTLSDGTTYDNNGTVHYADGAIVDRNGSVSLAPGSPRSEQVAFAQSRNAQASVVAAQAESMAGAVRAKAPSSITGSDIAMLEAAFTSLSNNIAGLQNAGDFGAQLQLMMAKGDVSAAIAQGNDMLANRKSAA